MDNIKRTGTGKPNLDPTQNTAPVEPKSGKFEGKLRSISESTPAANELEAVDNLKSRFTKGDLEDPAKREAVLHSAIQELMLDKLPQSMELVETDKQFL